MTFLSLFAVILVAVSGSTPRDNLETLYASYSREIHQRMNNEPVELTDYRPILEMRSEEMISALQGWERDHVDPLVKVGFRMTVEAIAQTKALIEVLNEEWPQIVEDMSLPIATDRLGPNIIAAGTKIRNFLALKYEHLSMDAHIEALFQGLPDTTHTYSFKAWVKSLVYGRNSPAVSLHSITPEAATLVQRVWGFWGAYQARQAQVQRNRETEQRRQQQEQEHAQAHALMLLEEIRRRSQNNYQPRYE